MLRRVASLESAATPDWIEHRVRDEDRTATEAGLPERSGGPFSLFNHRRMR